MKNTLLLISSLFVLTSCGGGLTVNSNIAQSGDSLDLSALSSKYGAFSITTDDGSFDYDEANKIYRLHVAETKTTFKLSGYFEGSILIDNANALSSFKGVKLDFEGAALVSTSSIPAVDYTLTSKNVEIIASKNTVNAIYSTGEAVAVYSENNLEINGKGTLCLASYGTDVHTVRSQGTTRIYDALTIEVPYSAHDAFHGNYLYFTSDDGEIYSGKCTVRKAVSQAFDFETSKGKGSIEVNGGIFNISDCASVFKTDTTLTIMQNAVITATSMSEGAIAQGDNSSGLTVTINGTFTLDGNAVTY